MRLFTFIGGHRSGKTEVLAAAIAADRSEVARRGADTRKATHHQRVIARANEMRRAMGMAEIPTEVGHGR